MKRNFIFLIAGLGILGVLFAFNFYWKNLRGSWYAFGPAPDVVSENPPISTSSSVNIPPAKNETGFSLTLPDGFSISIFARNLTNARVLAFDTQGNAWISQPSEGTVSMLEIKNGEVIKQNAVFRNLNNPHGLAFHPDDPFLLFIAEEHRISKVRIYSDSTLEKVADLPSGGGHYTRTIEFGPDKRLYVSVGSSCNVCIEKDERRAKILVYDETAKKLEEFAKGLRNSVFFTWHPIIKTLWATDNGRDLIGDDIPPDEVNIVEQGKNYGWPICYGKNIHDTNFDKNTYIRNPCMEPFESGSHIDLQAHSAPLGLAFIPSTSDWPKEYWDDLLVAYHGSWNRTKPTGYKIVRIPLDEKGNVAGSSQDFISGWLTSKGAVGRPVDIVFHGSNIYITDDKAGLIYEVRYSGK